MENHYELVRRYFSQLIASYEHKLENLQNQKSQFNSEFDETTFNYNRLKGYDITI